MFFARHQGAMWTGTPCGWFALLSSSLTLKLIGEREGVKAAKPAAIRARVGEMLDNPGCL